MKTKPTLTDEEIRSHMDFDKLLAKHTAAASTPHNWPIYIGSGVLVLGAMIYWAWPSTQTAEVTHPDQSPVVEQRDSVSIVQPTEATQQSFPVEKKNEQVLPIQITPSTEAKKEPQPTVPVFKEAEPVNGYPHLYEYFNRELQYPTDQVNSGLAGVVSVSFAINENGTPTAIRITNSLGPSFDRECQRIIEGMPAWRAATINGKATTTRLSLPLTFKANND